jgi:hypothetical protein
MPTIVFTHNDASFPIPVTAPAEVKLYAVPTGYSEDGYFVSTWMPTELEPIPASSHTLLCHLSIDSDNTVTEVSNHGGVSYAED